MTILATVFGAGVVPKHFPRCRRQPGAERNRIKAQRKGENMGQLTAPYDQTQLNALEGMQRYLLKMAKMAAAINEANVDHSLGLPELQLFAVGKLYGEIENNLFAHRCLVAAGRVKAAA